MDKVTSDRSLHMTTVRKCFSFHPSIQTCSTGASHRKQLCFHTHLFFRNQPSSSLDQLQSNLVPLIILIFRLKIIFTQRLCQIFLLLCSRQRPAYTRKQNKLTKEKLQSFLFQRAIYQLQNKKHILDVGVYRWTDHKSLLQDASEVVLHTVFFTSVQQLQK